MTGDDDFDGATHVRREAIAATTGTDRRRLLVSWTDGGGARKATIDSRVVIGSSSGAEIVIADPTVSRLHAELEPRDDGVWIRDLGSRNGTFVDEMLITGARLPDGARLRLGSTRFEVRYGAAAEPVALFPADRFGPLVGRSVAMREMFHKLSLLAHSDATVLISGETGTGKELVASALHGASARSAGPYIVVDCAALPENLLESELFGHARGAFTGAVAARAGAIELADGGTVFLDEIGELPLPMQPKLLRVIESRMVRRVGETQYRQVNVRFVSATHRDLREMVNAGAFREDLFFRLAVLPLTIPPLRARPDDIPALVEHFLERTPGPSAVDPELLRELTSRAWLGNVRELRNFVDRARALGTRDALASLPKAVASNAAAAGSAIVASVSLDEPFKDVRERWLSHFEREYIGGLLARHGHNVSAVAQASGLDRTYVHRLIKKHEL